MTILHQDPDSKPVPRQHDGANGEVTHLVHDCQVDLAPRLARCGYDCTDRGKRSGPSPDLCLACVAAALVEPEGPTCERCR